MVYLITYDLNRPGQDYQKLYKAIEHLSNGYSHCLDSTWLINTDLDADKITRKLAPYIDKNDRMLVVKITQDYQGWLDKQHCDWIAKHIVKNPM